MVVPLASSAPRGAPFLTSGPQGRLVTASYPRDGHQAHRLAHKPFTQAPVLTEVALHRLLDGDKAPGGPGPGSLQALGRPSMADLEGLEAYDPDTAALYFQQHPLVALIRIFEVGSAAGACGWVLRTTPQQRRQLLLLRVCVCVC